MATYVPAKPSGAATKAHSPEPDVDVTDFERSVWKKFHTSQAVGYATSVFQPGAWPAATRSPSLSQSCLHLVVAALVAALVSTGDGAAAHRR